MYSKYKLSLLVFTILLSVVLSAEDKKVSPLLGVHPEQLEYYQKDTFTCFASGKTIPISWVNDDYCDCEDGSDEPGTSACSNGNFFCVNKGYKGESISSIIVNNGICDCCDGSDEYSGFVKCENKCIDLSKEMRKAREELIEKFTSGLKAKAEMVKEAVDILKNKKEELDVLRKEIEPLNQEIKQLEVHKVSLEQQKQEREKLLEEERNKTLAATQQQQENDQQQEGEQVEKNNININVGGPTDENGQDKPPVEDDIQEEIPQPDHIPEPTDEKLDSISKDDQQQQQPGILNRLSNYWTSIVDVVGNYLPKSHHLNMTDIYEVESKLRELNRNLRDKQETIEKNEKLLSADLGPENVFLPLYGKCYDYPTRDYTYTVCPLDKATQGHTSLGKFSEWGPNYSFMSFTDGQLCWGGPKRSLKVTIECGVENKATEVQEPSKCEYTMKFITPAVCLEDHLKVLQIDEEHDH